MPSTPDSSRRGCSRVIRRRSTRICPSFCNFCSKSLTVGWVVPHMEANCSCEMRRGTVTGRRHKATQQGFCSQSGDDGHGHADQSKNFRRPHVQGHCGQRRGHQNKHHGGKGVAGHRSIQGHAQCLFALALHGQGIAIPGGGGGFGRARRVQQHSGDGSAEECALVQAHQKADGRHGRHVIGQGNAKGYGHGAVDAGYGPGDHASDHAQQHKEQIGQ